MAMSKIKKMLGVLMAAMLCFALTPMTAFAAGDKTLTIDGANGHTYKVYQVLTGDVSALASNHGENATAGKLANVKLGESVKDDTTIKAIEEAILDPDDSSKMRTGEALGNALWGFINPNKAVKTVNGEGSVDVPEGYYLVKDDTNVAGQNDYASRYVVAVVGNVTVKPKGDKPELNKEIADTDANAPIADTGNKVDTAAIGDVIEFRLTSKVPNMAGYEYYYYTVTDTMSEGLTFQNDVKVTIGGEDYTDVTVESTDANVDPKVITISVNDLKKNAREGQDIVITYSAAINENAKIGIDPNTNTAKLSYSNNPNESSQYDSEGKPRVPEGETPDSTTKTYVTQLALNKVDQDGNVLQGAEFELEGTNLNTVKLTSAETYVASDEGEWYKLTDGTYTTEAPTDETASSYASTDTKYKLSTALTAATGVGANKAIKGFVDPNGQLVFTGLNAGSYTLTETTTPVGYNTWDPINFNITAAFDADNNKIIWGVEKTDNVILKADPSGASLGVFEITVKNVSGLMLPSTGGIGTTIFYIVGGILVVGAIAFLIVRRRANSTK